jgi:hypothetical protein
MDTLNMEIISSSSTCCLLHKKHGIRILGHRVPSDEGISIGRLSLVLQKIMNGVNEAQSTTVITVKGIG